jgi:hypothetical protein
MADDRDRSGRGRFIGGCEVASENRPDAQKLERVRTNALHVDVDGTARGLAEGDAYEPAVQRQSCECGGLRTPHFEIRI